MKEGFLFVKNNIFQTLLALSEEEQAKGLMHQPYPAPIMSFVYATPKINKFWMYNTPSPLDIVFCLNGRINQIYKGEPYSTNIIGSNEYSDLVVEFPYGTIKQSDIFIGDKIGLIKPTHQEIKKILEKNNF